MSWIEYYNILKKHSSFRKAPKAEMKSAERGNPNDPQSAMNLAWEKYTKEKYGYQVLTHVHDEDCPKCGFPETIIVREMKSHKPIAAYCSKECGWSKKFIIKKKK